MCSMLHCNVCRGSLATTLDYVIPLLTGNHGSLPNNVDVGMEAMDSFLEFTGIQEFNEGTYVCVVSNNAGTREMSFNLQVECMYVC